jgi:hypothetical protein
MNFFFFKKPNKDIRVFWDFDPDRQYSLRVRNKGVLVLEYFIKSKREEKIYTK